MDREGKKERERFGYRDLHHRAIRDKRGKRETN
jgi:hypothetical protein